ncbi:MAG: glycosyltransferase family 87 protein [Acidocella sp.]|nr:glycosyltransferase family 87 protein [Acidocella sp.]
MSRNSQIPTRFRLAGLVMVCAIPSLCEAYAIAWGEAHGHYGKALRDGLDFWAGGYLTLHGQVMTLFNHATYQAFLAGRYGTLPYHLWSYPPNYLLLATMFGWLPPWPAVITFDALTLLLLVAVLRLARQSWWLIAAVLAAPATLENAMEHQNAALLTALIGGGILLLQTRPRLAGALIGLATIKPQLGLALPFYLARRAPVAVVYAVLTALALGVASLLALGLPVWRGFLHVTSPAMTNVLLTGQPPDFAGGLISVFALMRPLGLHVALIIQALVSLAAMGIAYRVKSPVAMLILCPLASPYLHDYDLLGVSLAVALLVRDRLSTGFAPGEPVLFFLAWFGPGLLPWAPQCAHAAPVILVLLLASACRRGAVGLCDSSQAPPGLPELSAGRSPTPAPPGSTARG